MFVRFVVDEVHRGSGKRTGLFQVAGRLRRSAVIEAWDEARLAAGLSWFNEHLDKPTRFTRTRRPGAPLAICWFKASASEHLARMREIASIIEACGWRVEMITSRRPGYVSYEDAFQIAACPFRETPA